MPYSIDDMIAASNVANQIDAMNSSDYNSVTSVKAAYNALSPDAKTFVGKSQVAKLLAANPAKPATSTKTVAQKLTLSNLTHSYSVSNVSSGKLKAAKSFKLKTSGAVGKVSYAISSIGSTAKKYITLNSAGKVTIKKNTPVGTYSFKVAATASKKVSGNTTYSAASTVKTVSVAIGTQSIKLSPSSKTLKKSALSKKAQAITLKAKTTAGKLSRVKNVSTGKTAKKFIVKKSGSTKLVIKVPKGTKKGTYTVKVQVKAPSVSKKCVATSVVCKFKVKVK